MSDILTACRIWIIKRGDSVWTVAPGKTRMAESVEPQPILQPAAYISVLDRRTRLADSVEPIGTGLDVGLQVRFT